MMLCIVKDYSLLYTVPLFEYTVYLSDLVVLVSMWVVLVWVIRNNVAMDTLAFRVHTCLDGHLYTLLLGVSRRKIVTF